MGLAPVRYSGRASSIQANRRSGSLQQVFAALPQGRPLSAPVPNGDVHLPSLVAQLSLSSLQVEIASALPQELFMHLFSFSVLSSYFPTHAEDLRPKKPKQT